MGSRDFFLIIFSNGTESVLFHKPFNQTAMKLRRVVKIIRFQTGGAGDFRGLHLAGRRHVIS